MENTLIRTERCPECAEEMLWTQNAWPRDAHTEAAFRCRNGHLPIRRRRSSALRVAFTIADSSTQRPDGHADYEVLPVRDPVHRATVTTGLGRATLRFFPNAAPGRATLGPVANRASPSAVRPGAPPLSLRR